MSVDNTVIRWVILLAAMTTLASCGLGERFFGSDGEASVPLPFAAQLSKSDDNRDFTVRVDAQGASLEDVRESARFQATRHCLTTFGRSDASWDLNPETGDWAFQSEGSDMILSGRCLAR